MGGIGSFIGAQLAENFRNDKDINVIFICRGKTKEIISKDGLTLTSKDKVYTVQPDLISDNPGEIGALDILILSTKSYALRNAVTEYKNCINENTVIIPLQNVVNAKELIENNIESKPNILEGCIYIASNIVRPGSVKHVGGPGKVIFGNEDTKNFQWVADILNKGGIDATYTKQIKTHLWKKYLFVSPVATITSAHNITFGQLAEDKSLMHELKGMMREIQNLANHFNVQLTDQDISDSLSMIRNFPYEAKSSLQLDLENQNTQTEKYYLIDYIINNGKNNNVNVNTYERMNDKISVLG